MLSNSRADAAEVVDGAPGMSAEDAVEQQLYGPMQEYEARVQSGRLMDDAHQRGNIYIILPCPL